MDPLLLVLYQLSVVLSSICLQLLRHLPSCFIQPPDMYYNNRLSKNDLLLMPYAPNAFKVSLDKKRGVTYIDSGASAHFINDPRAFTAFALGPRSVNLGNGRVDLTGILGAGEFTLNCLDTCGCPCVIQGTGYFCPTFPNSLISSHTLVSQCNISSHFSANFSGLTLPDTRQRIACPPTGDSERGFLYALSWAPTATHPPA